MGDRPILERIASALEALHTKGFIHRDVKPPNILFDGHEAAYLSDFGVAKPIKKLNDKGAETTTATAIAGTPGYMSPEQMAGGTLKPASDVYGLGIVLFEMLTGKRLFEGSNPFKQLNEPIPIILELNPKLSPHCQPILEKALALDPGDRYQTAPDVADAFNALLKRDEMSIFAIGLEFGTAETSSQDSTVFDNKFVYEHPVSPEQFFDRQRLIDDILQLIQSKQSTVIFGPPHMGKSSLLLKLQHWLTQDATGHYIPRLIDLNQVAGDYEPKSFWEKVCSPLIELTDDEVLQRYLTVAEKQEFKPRFLSRIFWHLRHMHKQLVLLIDNFERFLGYQSFQHPDFFAGLREFLTSGDLVLVITSRLKAQDMRERAKSLFDIRTVFLNPMHSKNLDPFSSTTVTAWLNNFSITLNEKDSMQIRKLAGHHPFLLQAIAAATTEATINTATEQLIETHFVEVWSSLDVPIKGILLALLLIERRAVMTHQLAHNSLNNQQIFTPLLQDMETAGLIRPPISDSQLDEGRAGLLLGNTEWVIDAQQLTDWLQEYLLSNQNSTQFAYGQWFNNEHHDWINSEAWDNALKTLRQGNADFSL